MGNGVVNEEGRMEWREWGDGVGIFGVVLI